MTIIISELTQASFILIHESYYSAPIQKCPLMNFEQDKLSANILVFAYRLVTVYLPLVALLWMTWLSSSDVELQFKEVKFFGLLNFDKNLKRFSDDGFLHESRYASKLVYNVGRLTGSKNKLTSINEI